MSTTDRPGREPLGRDYAALRSAGLTRIERAGSARWTDYNAHDPGITLLEAFAYAQTDLSYRTGFPVEDLLASDPRHTPRTPYPDQVFWTAREVLTVAATTSLDLRRVLADLDGVRNAWIAPDACCATGLQAWCAGGEVLLSHDPDAHPELPEEPVTLRPDGLFSVQLALEPDPVLGDLDDRRVQLRRTLATDDGRLLPLVLELRFPAGDLAHGAARDAFAADDGPLTVTVIGPHRTRTGTTEVEDEELRRHWREPFYVDLEIGFADGAVLTVRNACLRLFGGREVRALTDVDTVRAALAETGGDGAAAAYRIELTAAAAVLARARTALAGQRNLAEDVCRLAPVEVDDIAVCAEVEVDPSSDIERVQAEIWHRLAHYLDPPLAWRSLEELQAEGRSVEEIFDGPALAHGFLPATELEAAQRRTELRVSDIIGDLMGVPGVLGLSHVQLTAYDEAGQAIPGLADPGATGPPALSASWLLRIREGHLPRLHRRLSEFTITSAGLPFVPRRDEAEDILVQLRGAQDRPKLSPGGADLPAPLGRPRDLDSYAPVQLSLPRTYALHPDSLPAEATVRRRAQVQQLRAYLTLLEQLLRNGFAQLAHLGDLFSLDDSVDHTLAAHLLDETSIAGLGELLDGLDQEGLADLVEPRTLFLRRRHRFLDHLLARFGESFADHALLLTDLEGHARAPELLLPAKLSMLRELPAASHDRGRAAETAARGSVSGLQRRVNLLLGQAADARALVIEHLLLRPKFPGDAILPAQDGLADPYSFRLTYVMPAGTEPFGSDVRMRGFADRTIREQTPSHLLVRICWISNEAHEIDPCDPVLAALADVLEQRGAEHEEACECALATYTLLAERFDAWLAEHRLTQLPLPVLTDTLTTLFTAEVDLAAVPCLAGTEAEALTEIHVLAATHFARIARDGFALDRLTATWDAWRAADARIDWTQERLEETVQEILAEVATGTEPREAVRRRAAAILTETGTAFAAWRRQHLEAGTPLEQWPLFEPSLPSPGGEPPLTVDSAETLQDLLREHYRRYTTVSARLDQLMQALTGLRSVHPRATLHDRDDGSDVNPVRLGHTALGSA
ncbi:hypothetical protein [Brachybacterium vulturis]|uniref:hypothetical protein n=1 Tax=Brachybacterium vulturis TaxID=2017484 RepID=UPI003734E543